jgi:hypothetical protein
MLVAVSWATAKSSGEQKRDNNTNHTSFHTNPLFDLQVNVDVFTDLHQINWSGGNTFPGNSGHSPQGVLRLNGRELLFGEAKVSLALLYPYWIN